MLTTLPPLCADCIDVCDPEPAGSLWASSVCPGIALPLSLKHCYVISCQLHEPS